PPAICVLAEGRIFAVIVGNAFEPHLAVDGQTFAIAARTERGAALAIVSPPYPPGIDTTPEPPIVVPPDPKPTQGMPNLGGELIDLRDSYKDANGRRLEKLTHEQAGEMMARLVYRHRNEGVALFKKSGGNRCPVPRSAQMVSCDIVLHIPSKTYCD